MVDLFWSPCGALGEKRAGDFRLITNHSKGKIFSLFYTGDLHHVFNLSFPFSIINSA
jgi:hypothetical protein